MTTSCQTSVAPQGYFSDANPRTARLTSGIVLATQAAMGTLFSLGGILARWGPARPRWLPWALAALMLAAGACWDFIDHGGRIDLILIGLASYELAVGLTRDTPLTTSSPRFGSLT